MFATNPFTIDARAFFGPHQQQVLNQDFIKNLWDQLWADLPHRYQYHVPSPDAQEPVFRRYRTTMVRIFPLSYMFWLVLGAFVAAALCPFCNVLIGFGSACSG
jgi:hypothetical protein